MLYGALPGTETGKLSVPQQTPGGPSPAGAALAAAAGMSRSRARQVASPVRVSHGRFMVPPRSCLVVGRPVVGLASHSRSARDGQGEAGQGVGVVQHGGAQVVAPDRGQAVVARQAAALLGAPHVAV